MNYLLSIVVLMFFCSCSAPHQLENNSRQTQAQRQHEMAQYFLISEQISGPAVSVLLKNARENPEKVEPLYALGYFHMQSGIANNNPSELLLANTYLNEVITQFPGNQAVLQALYNIQYDNILHNRDSIAYEKAKTIFAQLPDNLRSSMNPPSLARFGAALLQQDKDRQQNRQELRDLLLQAIQESPRSDNAYIQLARLYREDRYFALALATLKLGEENIQSSAALYRAIGDTYIKRADVSGCNYEHMADIQKAGHYYQLAIALKPDDQALHFSLSEVFLDQNLYQLGLNEAKIALDLKPSRESISLNAQHFSVFGYPRQSLTLLQYAVAKGYSPNEAGYHEIYMNIGDWKNAASAFSVYIQNRGKLGVYDFIKNDMIAQKAHTQPLPLEKEVVFGNSWERLLFNYWQALATDEELKQAAHTRCEKTEYYFYTGYKDAIAGETLKANNKFEAVMSQHTYRFIERPLARLFLEQQSNDD